MCRNLTEFLGRSEPEAASKKEAIDGGNQRKSRTRDGREMQNVHALEFFDELGGRQAAGGHVNRTKMEPRGTVRLVKQRLETLQVVGGFMQCATGSGDVERSRS